MVLVLLDGCSLHLFLNKINCLLFKSDVWTLSTCMWIWMHFVIWSTNIYSDFMFFEFWFLGLNLPIAPIFGHCASRSRMSISSTFIFALTFLFVVKSNFLSSLGIMVWMPEPFSSFIFHIFLMWIVISAYIFDLDPQDERVWYSRATLYFPERRLWSMFCRLWDAQLCSFVRNCQRALKICALNCI